MASLGVKSLLSAALLLPTALAGSAKTSVKVQISDEWRPLIPITVNGHEVQLLFDTGSVTSWVNTQRTRPIFQDVNQTVKFPNSQLVKDGAWFVHFGSNQIAGGGVFETGVKIGDITLNKQAMGSLDVGTVTDSLDPVGGMFGGGFWDVDTMVGSNNQSLLQSILNESKEPIMATSFKLSGDSYIDFGFIDDKKYKGDIKYVDSNRKIGGWTFNSTTVSAGNAKKTFSAFIDSGVTSLSVPEELFSDYHKQIHGAQCEGKICGIPCNATLPDVQVDISGHKVTIKKDLLIFPGADDEGLCMSQVQKALVPGMNILGEPLYMSQYIVHKSANGKQQLGFADHA